MLFKASGEERGGEGCGREQRGRNQTAKSGQRGFRLFFGKGARHLLYPGFGRCGEKGKVSAPLPRIQYRRKRSLDRPGGVRAGGMRLLAGKVSGLEKSCDWRHKHVKLKKERDEYIERSNFPY